MTEPIQSSNPGLPIGPPVEPVDGMAAPARQPLTEKIVSLRPLDAARDAEALFRQHMIYKGRNRDTAWFAMLDHQWPAIKKNMERWLYSHEPNLSLAQLNSQRKSNTL